MVEVGVDVKAGRKSILNPCISERQPSATRPDETRTNATQRGEGEGEDRGEAELEWCLSSYRGAVV